MKNNKTSTSNYVKPNTNQIKLSDIVGQDKAIDELKKFIFTLQKKEIADIWKIKPAKGLLLVGPPGNGKTMSVQALTNEIDMNIVLYEMKFKDIDSMWIGGSVANLRSEFDKIRKMAIKNHVIVFIDEIDALLSKRHEKLHEHNHQRLNVFLEWMDGGMHPMDNTTVIGATNCLEKIDMAALRPGRFDRIIEFKPLTAEAIIKGFKVHLNLKQLLEHQVGDIDWDRIKDVLRNIEISGAAIPNILDQILNVKAMQHGINIDVAKSKDGNVDFRDISLFPNPISTEDILLQINNFLQSPHASTKK